MMDARIIREFLKTAGPEYTAILKKAIEQEEAHVSDPHYLGWEWHEVNAYPARLMKLVVGEIAAISYKSNRSTCYLLVDRSAIKEALR